MLFRSKWDERSGFYRCNAYKYRDLIRYLYQSDIEYKDHARAYNQLELKIEGDLAPYQHQKQAVDAWKNTKKGIVVLPTGTGKSYLASLIMELSNRSTLILAPTIDLVQQWQSNLQKQFGIEIGIIGGGEFILQDITVSTYDSARNRAEELGNRFCLLIFDEVHHLPSEGYAVMARSYLAPYRLGLTATPDDDPERQTVLTDIVGSIVFSKQITQLAGGYLAPYEVVTIEVELSPEEREAYDYHRAIYKDYRESVPLMYSSGRNSWEQFVMMCYRTPEGRSALKSFRIQKQIAVAAEGKLQELANILIEHSTERILIFTNDNKTAYMISSLFLLPLITHETKAKERRVILEKFRDGSWPFLVNSRVLNEGVDVPEANVAVVFSGTATVREHVQRLGRILRRKDEKKAYLYEMITVDTGEVYTSRKRRDHGAYENFS